jgi:lipopolysaccharide transport system ATP-binding protein
VTPAYAVEICALSKCFDLRRKKGPAFFSLQRFGAVRDVLRGRSRERSAKDQLWALRDVNFNVGRGEILGIIGRNGAGKSTLLKVLARILRPTAGSAKLQGRVASLLEMGMGFERELTVRENVFMYGLMNNVPEREAMARIESIAALAKLEDQLDTPLHHCPSGSYIRLAFSAVINLQADIILADEVLAVGDAAFQAECIEQIRLGSADGQSVLFVSHDMQAIRDICHRVVWIDKGRIVREGKPDDVVAHYSETLLGRTDRRVASTPVALPGQVVGPTSYIEHAHLASLAGAEIGALDMGSEAAVEFWVRVDAAVERFRVHAACFHDGKIAFSTSQPPCSVATGAGQYRVRLLLPAHYFNELAYDFRAVLEVHEGGLDRFVDMEGGVLFSVYNTDPAESAWGDWPWGRPGYICPRLDWQWRISPAAVCSGN